MWSRVPAAKSREQRDPRLLRLFRMELHAEDVVASHDSREGSPVVAEAQCGVGREIGRVKAVDVIVERGAVGKKRRQHRMGGALLGRPDLGPTDVREWETGAEADHPPLQTGWPRDSGGFLALRKQKLESKTDAEYGSAGRDDSTDRVGEASLREIPGALSQVPHTGQD